MITTLIYKVFCIGTFHNIVLEEVNIKIILLSCVKEFLFEILKSFVRLYIRDYKRFVTGSIRFNECIGPAIKYKCIIRPNSFAIDKKNR